MDNYGKQDAGAAQGNGANQETPDIARLQFMPPGVNAPPGCAPPQNSHQAPYQALMHNRLSQHYTNQPQYYNPLYPPYSGGLDGRMRGRQYGDAPSVYPERHGYPPVYAPYGQPDGSGKATASMVLGIIALVFSWTFALAFITIPCGIVGLILSNGARRTLPPDHGRGQATAGMVCSIIGLVIAGLMIAVTFIMFFAFTSYGINLGPSFGV